MRIEGSGRSIPSQGGQGEAGAATPAQIEKFERSMVENGVRPVAEHLMTLSPDDRAAVKKGLGDFAQAASKDAKDQLKAGEVTWPQYCGEMILYRIAEAVANADDNQLGNLGSAAAYASRLADLHSSSLAAGGKQFLDQINNLTGDKQQALQSAVLQAYNAYTSKGQQLTSMDSSLGSQISSTTGPTQQTTSTLFQMVSQLLQGLTQSLKGIMTSGG